MHCNTNKKVIKDVLYILKENTIWDTIILGKKRRKKNLASNNDADLEWITQSGSILHNIDVTDFVLNQVEEPLLTQCKDCNQTFKKGIFKQCTHDNLWMSGLLCANITSQNTGRYCDRCKPYCCEHNEHAKSGMRTTTHNVNETLPSVMWFLVDSSLQEQVAMCISHSSLFAERYFQYLKFRSNCVSRKKIKRNVGNHMVVFALLKQISASVLDYKWNYRIGNLVVKKMILDDAMAWLNTLGGGYSALGDYFRHCARKAGEISVTQFKLALEMGDPPSLCRCRLYYAQSLMQRGKLHKSKLIIRYQYKWALKEARSDGRLLAMCQGLWSKLRFYYRVRSSGH